MLTCQNSSNLSATRQEKPVWTCTHCNQTINPGHGFIGIKYADIRALNADQVEYITWECLHGDCADNHDSPDGISDNWYAIAVTSVDTWDKVCTEAGRLADKNWFPYSTWFDLIHDAADPQVAS